LRLLLSYSASRLDLFHNVTSSATKETRSGGFTPRRFRRSLFSSTLCAASLPSRSFLRGESSKTFSKTKTALTKKSSNRPPSATDNSPSGSHGLTEELPYATHALLDAALCRWLWLNIGIAG
jgi:hypothetical protein